MELNCPQLSVKDTVIDYRYVYMHMCNSTSINVWERSTDSKTFTFCTNNAVDISMAGRRLSRIVTL